MEGVALYTKGDIFGKNFDFFPGAGLRALSSTLPYALEAIDSVELVGARFARAKFVRSVFGGPKLCAENLARRVFARNIGGFSAPEKVQLRSGNGFFEIQGIAGGGRRNRLSRIGQDRRSLSELTGG